MFKNKNIEQLQKMAEESSKKLNLEMRIFDETMAETIKGVPEKDKAKVEEIRAMSQKAISHAKNGNLKKAQEIIKDYQNGSKSNK